MYIYIYLYIQCIYIYLYNVYIYTYKWIVPTEQLTGSRTNPRFWALCQPWSPGVFSRGKTSHCTNPPRRPWKSSFLRGEDPDMSWIISKNKFLTRVQQRRCKICIQLHFWGIWIFWLQSLKGNVEENGSPQLSNHETTGFPLIFPWHPADIWWGLVKL